MHKKTRKIKNYRVLYRHDGVLTESRLMAKKSAQEYGATRIGGPGFGNVRIIKDLSHPRKKWK